MRYIEATTRYETSHRDMHCESGALLRSARWGTSLPNVTVNSMKYCMNCGCANDLNEVGCTDCGHNGFNSDPTAQRGLVTNKTENVSDSDSRIDAALIGFVVICHGLALAKFGLSAYLVDLNLPIYSLVGGVISGSIAGQRGHSFLKWWAFGAGFLVIAVPMALSLKSEVPPTPKSPGEKVKDWAICLFCGILALCGIDMLWMSLSGQEFGFGLPPALLSFAAGTTLSAYLKKTKKIFAGCDSK
jgi:hypothetical protein